MCILMRALKLKYTKLRILALSFSMFDSGNNCYDLKYNKYYVLQNFPFNIEYIRPTPIVQGWTSKIIFSY